MPTEEQRENDTNYRRERAKRDPEFRRKRLEASRAWKARHVARINEFVAEAKNKPCVDCGQQYHPCCMEFDHVRGQKSFSLAKAARTNRTLDEVITEISKCDVRCVLCHRMRHLA